MALPLLYQTKEVLNKVLNSGEDALKVDIDNVTLTTEGADVAIDVALDKANDSVVVFSNTAKDGSGTNYTPLVDSDGHLQVDVLGVTSSNIQGINAEGGALPNPVLIAGDDGTDLKNINVDATTGDVQVDITHTVTVDGSGVTQPVSGTVTANLSSTDNAVLDTIDSTLDSMVYGTAVDINLSSDTTGLTHNALYIGTGGDVKVDLATSGTVTFTNLASGQILPIQITKVYSTANGTTASALIAMKE